MFRNVFRIEPRSLDAPPSARIRRVLGALAWISLWLSGFVAGWCISYDSIGLPLIYGSGGALLWFLTTRKHIEYGNGKYWYWKYHQLQQKVPSCGICGAAPGENCDAGLHS